jgi:tetratricopeptide (TPR) repeat protein
LSEDRQNPKILNNLGMAYYEKGDYKTAVGYFRDVLRIIEDKKQAPRPMTPFEVLNPAEIYILVGNAYWQMGEKKQALQFFQYSCTLEDSTSCHERIGKIYFDLGEWDACIGELVKVVQVKKDDPDIYGALGVALYRMNQPDKALAVFREGLLNIEDKKKASVLHQNLGHMYLQLQQPDQAISEFQLALASDWNNIGAHYGIAVAYMAQGQIDYAVGAVKNFEALAPQHEGVKKLKEQIEIMVTQMRAQSEAEMRQRMNLR